MMIATFSLLFVPVMTLDLTVRKPIANETDVCCLDTFPAHENGEVVAEHRGV